MSAKRPAPSETVTCPHCQGSIPISYEWQGIPAGATNVRVFITCIYCGYRVPVRAAR